MDWLTLWKEIMCMVVLESSRRCSWDGNAGANCVNLANHVDSPWIDTGRLHLSNEKNRS